MEIIRSLRVARATAMKARTQAINALKGLLVTAPADLREQLRGLSTVRLVKTAAALEPGPVTTPMAAASLGLRTLARGYQALSAELTDLDAELDRLTTAAAPNLLARYRGVLAQDPPASAQSGWGPPGQRGAAPDRGGPAPPRPTHKDYLARRISEGKVPQGSAALSHWLSIGGCDPESWVMAPR